MISNRINHNLFSETKDQIATLPGYIKSDSFRKMKKLVNLPVKYKPEVLYFHQEVRLFPKEFVYRQMLNRKLSSILDKIPFVST